MTAVFQCHVSAVKSPFTWLSSYRLTKARFIVSRSNRAWQLMYNCSPRLNIVTFLFLSFFLFSLGLSGPLLSFYDINSLIYTEGLQWRCLQTCRIDLKLCMWCNKVPLHFHYSSLCLHCSGWQVPHSKLQASKVLANYQRSSLPCEMWSVWDDNMAIHYSLELGASCRSMGRTYQEPNSGYFSSHRACSLTRKIYCKMAGGWPCLSTDWPVPPLLCWAGQGLVNDRDTFF